MVDKTIRVAIDRTCGKWKDEEKTEGKTANYDEQPYTSGRSLIIRWLA